ncbi:MAG: hypothetical protein A3K65_06680 [Euryarchaeota archaeon RBG_16_68_12]|nr:MAG: hypothetical protein A3K65_06680 [Euryarchaeota archaeon RBG_16_68_12]
MTTQRRIETFMTVDLCVVAFSILAAIILVALMPASQSLAEAELLFGATVLSLAVFSVGLGVSALFPFALDRSLLQEWHTTETKRLRRLLLPIPALWGVGLMAFFALAPILGAVQSGDAVIVEGVTAASLVIYLVVGPRYLAPADRKPFWHVRRFAFDGETYRSRIRVLGEAAQFSVSPATGGALALSIGDETLAEVRTRRKGGVYVRVRNGPSAELLIRLAEQASKGPPG